MIKFGIFMILFAALVALAESSIQCYVCSDSMGETNCAQLVGSPVTIFHRCQECKTQRVTAGHGQFVTRLCLPLTGRCQEGVRNFGSVTMETSCCSDNLCNVD